METTLVVLGVSILITIVIIGIFKYGVQTPEEREEYNIM